MSTQAWVFVGGITALLTLIVVLFNTLIGRKNRVHQAFSSIDVMLKKRFDLVPNLLAAANKYMAHERQVIERVSSLRAQMVAAGPDPGERVGLENQLSGALRQLFAVAESYPALRASENFLHLQASLNEVEEQLSASRRAFNAAVTDFNNGCEMFPLNIIAGMLGYAPKEWIEIPEEERQPVKIQ